MEKRPSPRKRPPERPVYQLLSLYRYMAYMVAVGLMLVAAPLKGQDPPVGDYIALGIVGAYVILRVVVPYFPRPGSLAGYASLALDLGIALGSLIATGGLNSGLLLYSLAPTLTASLLLEEYVAYSVAGITTVPLLLLHSTVRHYSWILDGNYLALFLVYAIAVSMVAVVPYRTNLNLRHRLVSEAGTSERLRLRREIHDSLAQELGFLNLKAKQLRDSVDGVPSAPALSGQVAELQETLQHTYADVRKYLDALTLGTDFTLTAALADLGKEFTTRTKIHVELRLPPRAPHVSPVEGAQFLGIAREALSNVQKHSGARRAQLSLIALSNAVEMTVEDDGGGFDPEANAAPSHYGLAGMKERAQEIGASCTVSSAPGQGTQVRVRLPR
ncbi:MAG: sensor histidine kinase [Chloroflexi bacterium]|nr:sensor histidine kinase [Chloroflexota bacterium]